MPTLRATPDRLRHTLRGWTLTTAVLDQVHDAVVVADLDGVIHSWNAAAQRIYGYTAEEVIGTSATRLCFPEDVARIDTEVVARLRSTDVHQVPELRTRCRDGREVYIDLRLSLLRDAIDRPVGMIGCLHDVTAARRARLAHERQQEELRIIFDRMPANVWYKDRHNVILRANRAAAAVAGLPPAEVEGRSTWELFPNDAAQYHRDDLDVIESGRPKLGIVERLQTASGDTRWVRTDKLPYRDEHGTIVGVLVFAVDITEQKRAEEALAHIRDALEERVRARTAALAEANAALRAEIAQRKEAEQRLELALWANDLGMWDWDARTGRAIGDARWAGMLGYAPHDVTHPAELWRVLTHPDDRDRAEAAWIAHVAEGTAPYYEIEQRLRTRGGEYRWVLSRAKAVERGPDGAALRVIGTNRDITGRKRIEEQASRRQAELAHLLRLHTANCVAGELAHEINQPLGAIANFANGLVNHLRQDSPDRAALLEAAEYIAAQALRAGAVLQRVREFIRKTPPHQAATDLKRLIAAAVAFVEAEAQRHAITIQLRLAPDLPAVLADAVQLEQVLINLLRNGIEAIVDSGAARGTIVVTSAANDRIEIQVSDDGPGVPLAAREQLFDPFFTTKPQGLGMGLSISRSIVAAHGGELVLVANGGRGATFRITLPAAG